MKAIKVWSAVSKAPWGNRRVIHLGGKCLLLFSS
jgi:hypothetical protein